MEPGGGEDMDVVGLRRDDDGKPGLDSKPSSPPVWRDKGVLGGTAGSGVFGGFFFL